MSIKKSTYLKYTLAAVVLLSIIAAMVFIVFTQEEKSDPASEKLIRKTASKLLGKNPDDLTDEDFKKITVLYLDELTWASSEPIKYSEPTKYINDGLFDIKLLEKFTNLRELRLLPVRFPQKNIPYWAKLLAKIGILDLKERFYIDLSPLEKLSKLQELDTYSAQVKNLEPLANLTNMRYLVLYNSQVSDIKPLKRMKSLLYLNLVNTQVSNLEPLKKLTNLQELDLRNCVNITDEQVEDLQKALPNLRIER